MGKRKQKLRKFKEPTSWSELCKKKVFEEHTLYRVAISCKPGNPWFIAYLSVGFLNGKDGSPGGYTHMACADLDGFITYNNGSIRYAMIESISTHDQCEDLGIKLDFMGTRHVRK